MSKLPKPRFNLKSPKSEKETLILMIFRYRGKKVQYSTGLSIAPSDWCKKDTRALLKERRTELINLNQELSTLGSHCVDIYIESDYGNISVEDFKEKLKLKTGRNPDKRVFEKVEAKKITVGKSRLFDFINSELQELESANMKKSSLKSLKKHAKIILEFGKYIDSNKLFDFEDVDWHFRLKLIDWLAKRKVQLAYGNKTLKILKQFLDSAKRQKIHSNSDYTGKGWTVSRKLAKGQKVYFDETELNRLAELKLNGRLEKIRDLCLIGAGTGQRFSDFCQYKPEQFSNTSIGIPILTVISEKSATNAIIPINIFPWLVPTLEKYNYTTPKISMQKFNEGLKDLAELVEFDQKILVVKQYMGRQAIVEKSYIEKYKLVSSHLCRRSFATNLYRKQLPLSMIMGMTGHVTESQLKEYIGIDNEQNAEQVGMMFM